MRPKLLPEGAVKIGDAVIIADVHIGLEAMMQRTGVYIPSLLRDVIDSIRGLLERENAGRLVIAGDLKHSFAPMFRERLELKEFVDKIKGSVDDIILVRGNHDIEIGWLEYEGVHITNCLRLHGWTVVHGHRPSELRRLVIGHEHPAVTLRDEVGASVKMRAFLVDEGLVVLPAFSPWAYGNDVLRETISPMLKGGRAENMRIIVPVGDELLEFGSIKELRNAIRSIGGF